MLCADCVNIYVAKDYKETAVGFCVKYMTRTEHWNDIRVKLSGWSTLTSKLTNIRGF